MSDVVNILVVEDDIALNNGVVYSLEQNNINVIQAFDLGQAREKLSAGVVDLIILDVNLPDGNGFEFCKEIRTLIKTPIIFLTAKDLEIDIVTGLSLGADDYITKPFSLMVLQARVMALLRRSVQNISSSYIVINEFIFDFENMVFYKKEQEIILSRTEQKLLKILVTNKGRTIPREMIMDKVWSDSGEYVDENALSVVIRRLRCKLEQDVAHPKYIQTVYGIGYVWAV